MKPSEVIIENLRGDGHKVEGLGNYKWIVELRETGTRLLVKGVKELSDLWVNNQP